MKAAKLLSARSQIFVDTSTSDKLNIPILLEAFEHFINLSENTQAFLIGSDDLPMGSKIKKKFIKSDLSLTSLVQKECTPEIQLIIIYSSISNLAEIHSISSKKTEVIYVPTEIMEGGYRWKPKMLRILPNRILLHHYDREWWLVSPHQDFHKRPVVLGAVPKDGYTVEWVFDLNNAIAFLERNELEKAFEFLNYANNLFPNHPMIIFLFGIYYFQVGKNLADNHSDREKNFTLAEKYLRKAYRDPVTTQEAFLELGRLYTSWKNEEREHLFKRGLSPEELKDFVKMKGT